MSQYNNMPLSYLRCSAEDSCPRSGECLHSMVWTEASDEDMLASFLPMVNLHCARMKVGTAECELFRSNEPVLFARGMSRIFDHVPHNLYPTVRDEVTACFSSRRTFFYCKSGEQLISPEEQAAVARVFQRHGLDVPPFDGFEKCYNWE